MTFRIVPVFVIQRQNYWLGFVETTYTTFNVYIFRATVQYTRACTSNWLHSIYHLLLPHASASGYCHLQGATKICSSLQMAISLCRNMWEQWIIISAAQRIGSASLYYLFQSTQSTEFHIHRYWPVLSAVYRISYSSVLASPKYSLSNFIFIGTGQF